MEVPGDWRHYRNLLPNRLLGGASSSHPDGRTCTCLAEMLKLYNRYYIARSTPHRIVTYQTNDKRLVDKTMTNLKLVQILQ